MQITSWLQSFGRNSRRRRLPSRAAAVERLEDRSLLSVVALLVGGELFVSSDGGDSIALRQNATSGRVEVVANGATLGTAPNVLTSAVTSIVIQGGDDANLIDLNAVSNATFPNITSIRIQGGNGDDVIVGSPSFPDSVLAGDGADNVNGQGGNDTLDGGDGNDTLQGQDGDDSLIGEDGGDSLSGDAGNDTLSGGDHADTIRGGDGNDLIDAGQSSDSVNGDNGNDTLNGLDGADTLSGDAGDDSILGGAADDSLSGGDGNDVINGQSGNDSTDGGAGADSVQGGDGRDLLSGGAGNDSLNGNAGDDTLRGDDGNDLFFGGNGSDSISAGDGDDFINGQGGNDTLFGDTGRDTLDGGAGNDLVSDHDQSLSTLPTLSVSHVTATEGNIGTVNAVFTVSLSSPSTALVTVNYSTKNGTAIAINDYVAQANVLSFQPGETSKTVTVAVNGDAQGEVDEVFFLDLSAPTNAVLFAPQGVATIRNDDGLLTNRLLGALTAFPAELYEVDTTTAAATFIGNIGVDFVLGLTTSPANVVYATRRDPLVGLITVNTTTGQGSLISELNPQPTEIIEGDLAFDPVNNVIFASFSGPSINLYRIDPATAATVNLGPLLFGGVPLPPQANNINIDGLVFRGNELFAYIPDNIPGVGDSLLRIDVNTREITAIGSFGVDLPRGGGALAYDAINDDFYVTSSSQAAINAGPLYRVDPLTGTATIVGVSNTAIGVPGFRGMTFETVPVTAPVSLSISDVNVSDSSVPATATLTVNLSRPVATLVMIEATTLSGSAVAGSDFTPITQTLTFLPGQISQSLIVPILPDSLADPPELFFVQLSNPSGALLTDALGTVTISDGGLGNTLFGGSGTDTVIGGSGSDLLNGGDDADVLFGLAGDDSILGGSGADIIHGGAGHDSLDGQGGSDQINSGAGDDLFVWLGAGSGRDTLANESGADGVLVSFNGTNNSATVAESPIAPDATFAFLTITESGVTLTIDSTINQVTLEGGNGHDSITVTDLAKVTRSVLTIRGGEGNDLLTAGLTANTGLVRLRLEGGNGHDTLFGGLGDDSLVGEAGVDRIRGGAGNDLAIGGLGSDSINGDEGRDTLFGGDGTVTLLGDGADSLDGDAGDDSIRGDQGNDLLIGDLGNDTVRGGDGDDTITGDAGNDSLLGESASDNITGGDGNDTLDGGRHNDLLNGSAGDDRIRGDHGDDTIGGGSGADTINGGDGDDVINGQGGADLIAGADGNDNLNGADGNDTLTGGDGDDTLLGGTGNDVVLGDQGDDSLNGQSSTDTLSGGQGDDTIIEATAGEIDESFVLSAGLLSALNTQ
ncbi:MAG: beta strand repeat-containing protein [Planctomycetaceae bacterium]